MTEQEIIDAGIDYQMSVHPICIGGDAFYEKARELNRNRSFEAGAKWVLDQLRNTDEDKLDELAINECAEILKNDILYYEAGDECVECVVLSDAEECYKAGYRKAMGNKI